MLMAPMRDELLLPPRLTSMAKQKKPGDSTFSLSVKISPESAVAPHSE